ASSGQQGPVPSGPPPWAPAYGYRSKHEVHSPGPAFDRGLVDTVQGLLSELLGSNVSRGQTQQFLSQLTPAELSAFLANPSQTLPDILPALLSVVHGHGNQGKGGEDVLLALFDRLLAQNPTPAQVREFFQALTPAQVRHLIVHRADAIGNLPGVPPDVRYAANQFRIDAELSGLDGRTAAERHRARTLEAFLADRGQYLHFDNAPGGRLANGTVSQVFGNLAEAQYVALLAFGRGNSMDTFAGLAQRGQLVHEFAQPLVREGMAVIAWLESLSPALGRQYGAMFAAWQSKGQTRNESQFLQFMQQASAKQMTQKTLPGLMLRGDARLTLVGHSFGSAVIKESLLQGAKPDACVFLGMPEQRLQRVAKQAGCGETDLYALLNHGDVVDELAVEDELPQSAAAHEPDDEVDWLAPGELGPPLEAVLEPHHDYLLEGSATLTQVVNVVVGRDVKLLPPKPQVITLYRSADGTFGEVEEPVQRMTRDL
ncbi:MAG: alpha/beta hydrolase, partial [Thermoanaerobaculia bacterium]